MKEGAMFKTYKPISTLRLMADSLSHGGGMALLQEEGHIGATGYHLHIHLSITVKDPERTYHSVYVIAETTDQENNPVFLKGKLKENIHASLTGTFEVVSAKDAEAMLSAIEF